MESTSELKEKLVAHYKQLPRITEMYKTS